MIFYKSTLASDTECQYLNGTIHTAYTYIHELVKIFEVVGQV